MSEAILHKKPVGGRDYWFRSPTIYDPALARRVLSRRRVRRPSLHEFSVAAFRGIEALAEQAGLPEEGTRQAAIMERWYALQKPIVEDDLDEPDFEKRAEELKAREGERRRGIEELYGDVMEIEANLERHYQPYADLVADRTYWDDLARIEIVRQLLVKIGDGPDLPRDEDGFLTEDTYRHVPSDARFALATFAFGLMGPDEDQRKNFSSPRHGPSTRKAMTAAKTTPPRFH